MELQMLVCYGAGAGRRGAGAEREESAQGYRGGAWSARERVTQLGGGEGGY